MKNIKKFICLLIVTVLITPSIAIAEDTYSGYFNNEEITMFADTSVKISENEKSAVEDIISDLNNIPLGNIQELIDSLPKAIQYEHPELFYVNLRQFSYKISRRSDNFGNNDQRPFHYGKRRNKGSSKID